jgi:hypothetical protein
MKASMDITTTTPHQSGKSASEKSDISKKELAGVGETALIFNH